MDELNIGAGGLNSILSDNINDDDARLRTINTLWLSIVEWFSLEDREAAKACFYQFYQENNTLLRNEKLASFFALKLLVPPGHQDDLIASYSSGSGEAVCYIANHGNRTITSVNIPLGEQEYHLAQVEYALKRWENTAPEGENRSTAAHLIRACIARLEPRINLSGLGITSLPESLPNHVLELYLANNQLTSLPELPPALTMLSAEDNQLIRLPRLPDTMSVIAVEGNKLVELPRLPDSLISLSVEDNQFAELPNIPLSLTELYASNNQLTHLPELSAYLLHLYVDENELTCLPNLPATLISLYMNHNEVSQLPSLPVSLIELHAYNNQLASLADLPAHLIELHIDNNQLASLPSLPNALIELHIDNNRLTHLPHLPDFLASLRIDNNQLTDLPALPQFLSELSVDGNQLTYLPNLPVSLVTLSAENNQLLLLPGLPDSLVNLCINNNQLIHLPELPSSLRELCIHDNQLVNLPRLPESLNTLYASNNQLVRLPVLPSNLNILYVSYNPLVDIPSLPSSLEQLFIDYSQMNTPIIGSDINAQVFVEITPHKEVAKWGDIEVANKWKDFRNETNIIEFIQFLSRLSQTQNSINREGFKCEVSSWLNRLANNEGLRALSYRVAVGATESCEDRVTYTYHMMKNEELSYEVRSGKFDENLPQLIDVGRQIYRLENIERIARAKAIAIGDRADEIEIHLAYQNKLRHRLNLTTITPNARFIGLVEIDHEDINTAEMAIKRLENSQFKEWYALWDAWHDVVARILPSTLSDAKENSIQKMEEIGIDASAFKQAKSIIFTEMTQQILAEKEITQSLDAYWQIS